MQEEIPTDKKVGVQGGSYARTEEELYEKAIALLEKCKIEPGRSGQKIADLEPAGGRLDVTPRGSRVSSLVPSKYRRGA